MFGVYVRFKRNYVALMKSSNNWKQHLSLEQWWIIGYMMLMWLSSFIIKEDTGAIRIIRILESLTAWGILLQTVGQIWVFLCACFLHW